MNIERLHRVGIKIPDNLSHWVVGFLNIDVNEYEFYLRDFPIQRVKIKASKVRKTDKYFAEANHLLKVLESQDRYIAANGISTEPLEAILICLEKFINKGKVFGVMVNKSYMGIPIPR